MATCGCVPGYRGALCTKREPSTIERRAAHPGYSPRVAPDPHLRFSQGFARRLCAICSKRARMRARCPPISGEFAMANRSRLSRPPERADHGRQREHARRAAGSNRDDYAARRHRRRPRARGAGRTHLGWRAWTTASGSSRTPDIEPRRATSITGPQKSTLQWQHADVSPRISRRALHQVRPEHI